MIEKILVSLAALAIIVFLGLLVSGRMILHCDKDPGKADDCYFKFVKKNNYGRKK